MMNLNHKTISMNRLDLLEALRKNLEVFKAEYAEACEDYRVLLIARLYEAHKAAIDATPEQAAQIKVKIDPPADHRTDYTDAIEMLECSAEDKIDIDQRSFKAYVKNEWDWTKDFKEKFAANKSDPHASGAMR